jgi:hypothetical protein
MASTVSLKDPVRLSAESHGTTAEKPQPPTSRWANEDALRTMTPSGLRVDMPGW